MLNQQGEHRRQVEHILDTLHSAAAGADGARYFPLFRPDAIFLGTDVRERWTFAQFRKRCEPLFAAGRGWVYKMRHRHIGFSSGENPTVAWFDEVLDSDSYGTSRGTGVMLLENGAWAIAQYALCHPIPNDVGSEIIAKIKAYESEAMVS